MAEERPKLRQELFGWQIFSATNAGSTFTKMSRGSDLMLPQQHDAPSIEAMQIRMLDGMCHSEDASKRFIGQQELHAI
ncbi:hypothetical protein HO173_010905 [Letharia columbiana]|uniref:Uncharacterized protein n=1 Tax=Letharia columbiana TaxID=112416 RepID=A0A8H6L0A9_9LECA|nr:uncharacterized protein HO173_010905 [Letharia columbiana]KAF6230789.1 hypothetical protein HO173_010905 [Letharia columbiana]